MKVLVDESGQPTKFFTRQARMFGKTRRDQLQRLQDEAHAYYDLVIPNSIQEKAHMLSEFQIHTHKPSSTWLQTITLI